MSDTKEVRVTFQRDFVMRKDQSTDSVAKMYEENYGMKVTKVEDIIRCKACQIEVSAVTDGLCACCNIVRDGLRDHLKTPHESSPI